MPVHFVTPAASVPFRAATRVQVAGRADTTLVLAEASYAPDFSNALTLGDEVAISGDGIVAYDSQLAVLCISNDAGTPWTTNRIADLITKGMPVSAIGA